jgi:hypothetical protein
MPYLTLVRDGVTPSVIPAFNQVSRNFIVANYGADGGCLDNDDGSSFYNITQNFCVYGGQKSDFDGHAKVGRNNLHVFPAVYGPRCLQIGAQYLPGYGGHGGLPFIPGFADVYENNTCILETAGEAVVALDVSDNPLPPPTEFVQRLSLGGNTIYVPGGQAGYEGPGSKEWPTYAAFQAAGYDAGSTVVAGTPATAQIIAWAQALLEG